MLQLCKKTGQVTELYKRVHTTQTVYPVVSSVCLVWPGAQFPVSFWNRQTFFKRLTPLWGPVLRGMKQKEIISNSVYGKMTSCWWSHNINKMQVQAPTRVHSVSNTPTSAFTHTPYNHPSLCYVLPRECVGKCTWVCDRKSVLVRCG